MSNGVARRSLQEKVSITLLAVMGALALLSFIVLKEVVAPAFDELELKEAQTNLNRAEKAIANDLENLSAIAGDWGLWDDAYDYVTDVYPAFQDSNLDRPNSTTCSNATLPSGASSSSGRSPVAAYRSDFCRCRSGRLVTMPFSTSALASP